MTCVLDGLLIMVLMTRFVELDVVHEALVLRVNLSDDHFHSTAGLRPDAFGVHMVVTTLEAA